MLATILCCTLAALADAAPAAFISYKIAYTRGKLFGCRYAMRYRSKPARV